MEARACCGQKKSPEDANQMIQAEVQKMRVEMSAMKRDAEHYSRQEHMELEKRYRELTDLLYYKQTQLEAMAGKKAASEFQLEKEMKRLQEAQVEAERSRVSRRASSSWKEDTDMKTLDYVSLFSDRIELVNLQNAAKLLDSGAVRATRFLWRYPIARILPFFYLCFELHDDHAELSTSICAFFLDVSATSSAGPALARIVEVMSSSSSSANLK
ncbi:hypothetical protein CsSME_00022889 [Camellia sinensis var. sinensis]